MRIALRTFAIRLWVILIACPSLISFSQADATEQGLALDIKPSRCIALHQGQTCYQNLKFYWLTPKTGEYCLFRHPKPKPLVCWIGNQKTFYLEQFESKSSVGYQIRMKGSDKVLLEANVNVAWVYKAGKKSSSGWRLF